MKLAAILWDYDGTLVNSVPKNIDITKSILAEVAPHLTGENLPVYLHNEDNYHEANHASENWQDLYINFYGLTEKEMLKAGSMWADHQEKNQTEVSLFEGIEKVISQFSHLYHGICSQNSQANIRNVLKANGIDRPFKAIVGYKDVPADSQKPNAHGGLKCLNEMELVAGDGKLVLYIGDHEADVVFARNLESALGEGSKVVSVAVTYSRSNPSEWSTTPDHTVDHPEELVTLFESYV